MFKPRWFDLLVGARWLPSSSGTRDIALTVEWFGRLGGVLAVGRPDNGENHGSTHTTTCNT